MLSVGVLAGALAVAPAWAADGNRSTNIALNRSGTLLYVANREANSLTIFRVAADGSEVLTKLDRGRRRRGTGLRRRDRRRVFVANAASGTVSVVERLAGRFRETAEFDVGPEPRGCALNDNRSRLFVTNFTAGTVSVIDTQSLEIIDRVPVGEEPYGITIVRNTAFVTQFFGRLIDGGPGEGFDTGKEGVVRAFRLNDLDQVEEITLAPLADSGFTANRTNLCQQFNPLAPNNTFCPDTDTTDPADPDIIAAKAGVFPNQLKTALACDGLLYLPNVGAQPEPPVAAGANFDTNVQALVHVVDIDSQTEREDLTVNLNQQINTEVAPVPVQGSLAKLFGNEIVAIDADPDCENFFIVSRGGNFVLKAQLDQDGKLDINAPDNVVRFQTGNIPTGIVVDWDKKLAFVNNEVDLSVSVLDLDGNPLDRHDVASGTVPEPGSFDHTRLLGKLVFFTALGVPDNGLVGTPIREIVPVDFRGKQSQDAWSSCGSCHDEGLADGVTWIFGDGPRQTIPMNSLYSKVDGAHDTRINNWSAARDCVTDFNNNSRGVQGGDGFASDPPFSVAAPNPNIFDHGICQGASEALDFETTWAQTIRTLNAPQPEDVDLAAGSGRVRRELRLVPRRRQVDQEPGALPQQPVVQCQPRPPAARHPWRAARSGRAVHRHPDPILHRSHGRPGSAGVPGAEHRRVRSGQSDRDPAERQSVARRARHQRAVPARGGHQLALLPQRAGADARAGVRHPPTSGWRDHRRSGRGGRPARLRRGDRRPDRDLPLGRRPLPRAGHAPNDYAVSR